MYLGAVLAAIDRMPQGAFDEVVEKYVEMNVAHPFREGNGRSTRIWLDCILRKELGWVVDWSRADKEDYLLAMERSPVRDTEIKALLKAALTDAVDDRQVYMKGIDASCRYEGYSVYTVGEVERGSAGQRMNGDAVPLDRFHNDVGDALQLSARLHGVIHGARYCSS